MPQMPFLASILVTALRVVALQDPAPPAGQQPPAPAQAAPASTPATSTQTSVQVRRVPWCPWLCPSCSSSPPPPLSAPAWISGSTCAVAT